MISEFETPANAAETDLDPAQEASPADETAQLREEIAQLKDKVLRLAAEIENTRRRGEREKQDAGRYAIASFARDLLNVADTFERALASAPKAGEAVSPETVAALIEGVRMTDQALLAALERHGVRRLAPKGERFDPHLHMAVAQAPGAVPSGHVLDVAQPGFVIGDRVLRAAMVVVSTGPAEARQPEAAPPPPGAVFDGEA